MATATESDTALGVFEMNPLRSDSQEASVQVKPACDPVTLRWESIIYNVKCGKEYKTVLRNLYGTASPGTLTAVMGPSGSGKTSLLHVLTGYVKSYKGRVMLNGYSRDPKLLNLQSCYLMQEEQQLSLLTVREALTFAADLLFPVSLPKESKKAVVNESIELWGLQRSENTRADKLSGGEFKRLILAQELLRKPPVIFLDEPTTGLDSASSLKCVQVLKSFAKSGHTIVITVHQPSAKLFAYFDELYMLAEGHCIYNGTISNLIPFLSSFDLHCAKFHNPADYITEVACGLHGSQTDMLANHFTSAHIPLPEDSSQADMLVPPTERKHIYKQYSFKTSSWHQFQTLTKRVFISTIRNKLATHTKLAAYVFGGLLVCVLFYGCGERASQLVRNLYCLLYIGLLFLLTCLIPTVILLPPELNVFYREHRNRWYGLKTFYFAKVVADLPFQLIPPIIFTVFVYNLTWQPYVLWRQAAFLAVLILHCIASQSFGMMASSFSSTQTAIVTVASVCIPLLMFTGVLAPTHTTPSFLQWVYSLSYFYYTVAGGISVIYGYDRPTLQCVESSELCFLAEPKDILKLAHFEGNYFPKACIGLIVADLLFRTATCCILKWRLKRKI